MGDLANSLAAQGKHADAVNMGRKLLGLNTDKFGEQDGRTMNIMSFLVGCHHAQGEHDEVVKVGRKLLALRTEVLGPHHEDTLEIMRAIPLSLAKQGKHDEA